MMATLVMTGAEIDVHLEEKGIKMVVNPFANKNDRKPNMFQSAFADFFNDINAVRDDIHKDIQRQSKGRSYQQTGAEEAEPLREC